MSRALLVAGIVVGLCVLSSAAPAPKSPPSIIEKLIQRIDFNGVDDPKATLNDVLEKLSTKYGVSFDINEKAFQLEGLMEIGRTPIAETAIPSMKNARLERVLHTILQRVPSPSGTTFYVHDDYIEILTGTYQRVAVWGAYDGPRLPLVNTVLEKCPLEDAVRRLADLSNFTIVLDKRAGDKGQTPVSARFLNTPLDTAVRLLADMTDLQYIHIDNVLYVTTKENAAALEARLKKERTPISPMDDHADPSLFNPRKGAGPQNIIISPGVGAAG